jgi:hypothetical protein
MTARPGLRPRFNLRRTANNMIETPPPLQPILAALNAAAGAPVYLVGGAVRDLLRGVAPNDLDVAVEGDARAAARSFADTTGAHVFALDEERAQMRVVLDTGPVREVDFGPVKDGSEGDRKGRPYIETDLETRDFTINAMALPIKAGGSLGALIDPTGGAADLRAKRLRTTGEAALIADPLRLLRAVRFAVELGFEVERETASLIKQHASLLTQTAPERQRDELVHIFETPRAAQGLRLLDSLGLLHELLPELDAARGCDQPANHHYYDVFEHSIETVAVLDAILSTADPKGSDHRDKHFSFRRGMTGYELDAYLDGTTGGYSRRVLLKIAGLLHDVAKPETKTVDASGRIRLSGSSVIPKWAPSAPMSSCADCASARRRRASSPSSSMSICGRPCCTSAVPPGRAVAPSTASTVTSVKPRPPASSSTSRTAPPPPAPASPPTAGSRWSPTLPTSSKPAPS